MHRTVRTAGDDRLLTAMQESLLVRLIVNHRPDELMLPQPLWTRGAVGEVISQRLRLLMPARTLATVARWVFVVGLPLPRSPGPMPSAIQHWLADEYPGVAALSKVQDGEIGWAGQCKLAGDQRLSIIWDWLLAHEEAIQVFHLPAMSAMSAVPPLHRGGQADLD